MDTSGGWRLSTTKRSVLASAALALALLVTG